MTSADTPLSRLLDSILDDRPPGQSESAARYAQNSAFALIFGLLCEMTLAVGYDGPIKAREAIGRRTAELVEWINARE
jgi:hypothetical protein